MPFEGKLNKEQNDAVTHSEGCRPSCFPISPKMHHAQLGTKGNLHVKFEKDPFSPF